ncbi:aldehyde dehydrogenase family protein [Arthrobacter sp. 18067]|uniref:aldehyde dehydrogenase family protein n=1 Tax=Arthrobacter sp. 18067 TaxID=2681413 RepID=UPI00135827E4|nr:aldehyde dehydrogenase family protein [Arthrobacter sp. 18067]
MSSHSNSTSLATVDVLPVPTVTRTQAFIDGEFVDAQSGRTFPTYAPSTGHLLAMVADGGVEDVDRAALAARRAFDAGSWSHADVRRAALTRLADLVEENAQELAALDAIDAGKPITDCETGDIPEVAHLFRWYAEAIDKVFGKVSPTSEGHLGIITREPVGVVGIVVPWNYPAVMLTFKAAPALAAGNCVVAKPAEQAPLSALRLAELATEAGFPPGVFNVVPGDGPTAGRAVGMHPLIDAVAFTGSTQVGREFLRYAAESNMKNVVLELGGKSPQIVMADMKDDLTVIAEDLAGAAFGNAGQNCTAGSRVLVANGLREELTDLLAQAASKIRLGDPMDRSTEMGPLIERTALERVSRYVDEAVALGARVRVGGSVVLEGTGGHFYPPTVLDQVTPDMAIAREEIFGPVVAVLGFDTEEEALQLANDSEYGLAATVWSHDVDVSFRMARGIRAGTVAINGYSEGDITTPFGGHRASGFGGRDSGVEAMEQYTELKTTWFTLR